MNFDSMCIGIVSPIELGLVANLFSINDAKEILSLKSRGGTQPAQLGIALGRLGKSVAFITLSPSLETNEIRQYTNGNYTLLIGGYRDGRIRVLQFQKEEIRILKKMIGQTNLDIIHAHWTYEFAIASIKSDIPHLITVRDWPLEILKRHKKLFRVVRFLLSLFVFAYGKKFNANSQYIDKKLFFLKRKKYSMVPNAISDSLFRSEKKEFNVDIFKIVSINHGFDKIKNVKKLLKSFNQALKTEPSLSLDLIGSEYEENGACHKWALNNQLAKNVNFIGAVSFESVLGYLDSSDLLVHPSVEESFGNTLVEAMARKVPVVAGKKSGAVPWVIQDSGVLVDVNDINEICSAILLMVNNSEKRNYYSEAGYQNAKSRFSLENSASQYLNIYRKIIRYGFS